MKPFMTPSYPHQRSSFNPSVVTPTHHVSVQPGHYRPNCPTSSRPPQRGTTSTIPPRCPTWHTCIACARARVLRGKKNTFDSLETGWTFAKRLDTPQTPKQSHNVNPLANLFSRGL